MSVKPQYDPNWQRPAVLPQAASGEVNTTQIAIRLRAVRTVLMSNTYPRKDGWSTYAYTHGIRGQSGYKSFVPKVIQLTEGEVLALGRAYAKLAHHISPLYPDLKFADYQEGEVDKVNEHVKGALQAWRGDPSIPYGATVAATKAIIKSDHTIDFDKIDSWLTPQPHSHGKTMGALAALLVVAAFGFYYRAQLADLASQIRAKVWARG